MKEFTGPPDKPTIWDKATINPLNGESLSTDTPSTGLPIIRGEKETLSGFSSSYVNKLLGHVDSCKDRTSTIRNSLTEVGSILGDPLLRNPDLAREHATHERRALFGDKFTEALVTYPIHPDDRYVSPATFARYKTGEALPSPTEFTRLADHMGAPDREALDASDRPGLPHELRRELEGGLRAAHAVPWLLKEQLAAGATATSAAATQLAATSATVDHLRTEIVELEAALAAVAAGSEEELRLRAELDAANTRLREVLAQHQEDSKQLVACATDLSGRVTAYVDYINESGIAHRRAPTRGLRRRKPAASVPEVRRPRRAVAGRRTARAS
jgi:exonuclease VII small subunit